MTYPPEPWRLLGRMHVSIWLVPRAALPALPSGLAATAITVGGRAIVGAAWVTYEPGGVLDYRELLAARLVRDGLTPLVSITDIWVDSIPSRDGGRALWGIPKDLADLRTAPPAAAAATDGRPIAQALLRPGRTLPGRWPFRFRTRQVLRERPKTTSVRGTAAIGLGRADWTPAADGPLSYLAGRRPLLSITLADFDLSFGG